MKQFWKRSLSLVLTAALVLAFLPASGSAQELGEQSQTETPVLQESTDSTIAETSGKEVVAFRTENEKHYYMGDGVFQAIAYSHPVHEQDASGQWQDIDFGLSLTRSQSASLYTNKAAGVVFPSVYTPNQPIMALSGDKGSVSMELTANSLQTARAASTAIVPQVENPQNSFRTLEEANNAVFSSSIVYADVLPGVDLEYIVDPGTVKENIIVKQKADSYRYTFTMELDGLTPVMQQDGGILLYPTGSNTPEYVIPAPYMYDALGNFSESVVYTLTGSGSTYALTVNADESWINANGRSFPVTIDPGLIKETETVFDTFIDSDLPDNTRATTSTLWIRNNRITYIRMPNISIPENAILNWATLSAFYFYNDNVTKGYVTVTSHRMTSSWRASTLTWTLASNMPGYYGLSTATLSSAKAYGNLGATVNSPMQIDFPITSTVRGWLNGSYPNYGIGLKYDSFSTNQSVVLKSSESSYLYRPRITYEYGNLFEYISYYDNSMSPTQIANISTAVNFACNVFNSQFDMAFYSNATPAYRGDLADECEIGTHYRCTDACSAKDQHHHKDISYISEKLLSEIDSSHEIIIYWTDRNAETYCSHDETGNCYAYDGELNPTLAGVISHRPVIHIMNLLPDHGSNAQDLACMAYLLVHETAHALGMEDVYDEPVDSHEGDGYQCVMERISSDTFQGGSDLVAFYNAVASGSANAFCEECKGVLLESLGS